MRITHVIPYMHPHAGGPPVVVDRMCQGLATRGWDVRVITTDSMATGGDPGWQARYAEHYSIDVHETNRLRGYAYSSTLPPALQVAARDSDLFHLHTLWTFPTYVAAKICRQLGTPFVVMPHGMADPNSLSRNWLRKKIYGYLWEWRNLRSARGMIYTHAEERRLAEKSVSGLPEGHIVPLGADEPPDLGRAELAERFLRARPELRGKQLVIFLGRLHPKKGLDLLIPAFAQVVQAEPNAHLLLVGPGDEPYVQSLQVMAQSSRVAPHVTFVGPLASEAKWGALAASSVFALSSYQENFALTVVEALRSGVPVVLSQRVNIWEDVTQCGAGIACDLTVASVANAIITYLRDPNKRAASAESGRQLVAERFNWNRSVDAIENVYRQILSAKSAITA